VGPRVDVNECGKYRPNLDSISGPSSQSVQCTTVYFSTIKIIEVGSGNE